MSLFRRRLFELNASAPSPARFLFVAYDQLNVTIGPLARHGADELGIVVVECPQKARKRPYHRQKLALLLTNLRHFALEQAAAGRRVVHLVAEGDYASALRPFAREHGRLVAMTPAERELRCDLAPLVDDGLLELVAHDGWLSDDDDFDRLFSPTPKTKAATPTFRMDAFYREQRRRTGLLMHNGAPLGGRFSHDGDNRQPWKGRRRRRRALSSTTSPPRSSRLLKHSSPIIQGLSTLQRCQRPPTTPKPCGSGQWSSACRISAPMKTR